MGKKKNITIRIDGFPTSWRDLTYPQWQKAELMYYRAMGDDSTTDEEKKWNHFRLLVFLEWAGLKVLRKSVDNGDGTRTYFLRRKGFRHLFEEIPVQSCDLSQWIIDNLGWMDKETVQRYVKIPGLPFVIMDHKRR